MQPFGVLDRYIGKTIFTTIMMTLFMLVSLSGIIKFVDQLKKAGQGSYDALGAGMYTLLSVPKDVQIFFPMAALLGALLGLGMLAQRSELVVMQASGFTRMQVALSVMKTAIPLVLLTMAIGEWVAPQGEQMARNYRAQAMYGGSLLSTQQGLWAKDGNNFVYIERVKGDEELGGISIYAFNENRRLQSVRYAATAKFDPEHKVWRLSQVDESDLTNPKTDYRFADGERHLENQPHARQTGRGGAGPGCTLNQRFAQLREVSEVERSGRWTLSAQHVEQNLPAAIRGGDDADGAVVHLWPTA